MNPPPAKNAKSILEKLFIMDAEGAYAAEYPVDESCELEFEDFLAVLGNTTLSDMQTLKLGENEATLIQGDTLSLIAISKGPLRSVELTWSKAILNAMEGFLSQQEAQDAGQEVAAVTEPSPPSKELDEREKELERREKAVGEAEERAWKLIEQENESMEELNGLREELKEMESRAGEERQKYESEIDRLRNEIAEKDVASLDAISNMVTQEELDKLQADREALNARALELDAKQKSLEEREAALASSPPQQTGGRQEVEVLRAQLEAARRSIPPFDAEAARRELDRKANLVQEKATELLRRENMIHRKESELHRLMKWE